VRRPILLPLSMQRLELRMLLGAVLLLVVAALGLAWQMRAVGAKQQECQRNAPPVAEDVADELDISPCPEPDEALSTLEQAAAFVKVGIIGTPIVVGLFLGVPLVAREVESRTAALAWSLSRSRRRWLLWRATPVLAVTVIACLAAGLAGDVLAHAPPRLDGYDPGFEDWFARGPQVAVRGMAIGAIGLLIGALVGRQLPALLLAAIGTLALFVATTLVMDGWMKAAAEPVVVGPDQIVTGKIYGGGLRNDATGQILIDAEAAWVFNGPVDEFGMPVGYSNVFFMVPSRHYGEFVLYEAGLFGVVAVGGAVGAVLLVSRRRP
jgi:hypothetical protein